MSGASEQAGTKVRAVQNVVNHAADIHPPSSAHEGILPHPPRRKKVPDTVSSRTDVALQNWPAAGLRVASTVRLSRLDCLEQNLLRRRLGMVDQSDAGQLKQVWANEIRLRF
jgi:hypothetical protein